MANGEGYIVKDWLRVGTVLALLGIAVSFGRNLARIESDIFHLAQDQAVLYRRLDDHQRRYQAHRDLDGHTAMMERVKDVSRRVSRLENKK